MIWPPESVCRQHHGQLPGVPAGSQAVPGVPLGAPGRLARAAVARGTAVLSAACPVLGTEYNMAMPGLVARVPRDSDPTRACALWGVHCTDPRKGTSWLQPA